MNRVLVPLDGSRLSEAILPLAEALARDYEADVLLVRALRSRDSAEVAVRAQEEAEAYLEGIARGLRLRGLAGVAWKVWYDAPDRAIVDAARFNGVDLIAMSTHGRGGLTRLLFGSVAESLVRKAPVPVLLVRGEFAPPPGTIGRILVPLDGSELSEGILPVVERLAGPFDWTIDLLHAVEPLPGYATVEISSRHAGEILRLATRDAETRLAKVAVPLEDKGLRAQWAVREGPAVDVILRYARDAGASLIAMSTHGRSGLGRFFLGSVAERVLREASVPVLIWKAPAEGRTPRPPSAAGG
ncbi:MAG TPA: universal stress protein [Methylomirabilota bacterium]|nr:universal stress protein [Methylomirabilota bacterium]